MAQHWRMQYYDVPIQPFSCLDCFVTRCVDCMKCLHVHFFCAGVQHTEIVLTAHPTQVNRRTLQHKHCRIAALLAQNDRWSCLQLSQSLANLAGKVTEVLRSNCQSAVDLLFSRQAPLKFRLTFT